jgi:hypothetical protein
VGVVLSVPPLLVTTVGCGTTGTVVSRWAGCANHEATLIYIHDVAFCTKKATQATRAEEGSIILVHWSFHVQR